VAQLNYQLIAQHAQIHRSIAQRLLSEIMQRLAAHIVSGHAIKVLAAASYSPRCCFDYKVTSGLHSFTAGHQQRQQPAGTIGRRGVQQKPAGIVHAAIASKQL
jgi:hypothetical protein